MEWPHQENISNPLDGHFTKELDKRYIAGKNPHWQGASSEEVSSSLIPQNLELLSSSIPII